MCYIFIKVKLSKISKIETFNLNLNIEKICFESLTSINQTIKIKKLFGLFFFF
jgi:hypothetical protein